MKKASGRYGRLCPILCGLMWLVLLVSCENGPVLEASLDTLGNAETQAVTQTVTEPLTNAKDTADTAGAEVITIPEVNTEPNEPSVSAPTSVDPQFSISGGFLPYADELLLTLPKDAPQGAYISYTTDGAEPSAQGKRYDTAIPVLRDTLCTVIRAAVFSPSGEQLGHTVTETYCQAGISSLRIVSLVTDPQNLYGASGILDNRDETGKAGERPVSLAIFEPDGELLLKQDAAIRLAGAGSKTFDPVNFRIIARSPEAFEDGELKYSGDGKFSAQLFEASACDSYDRFLLRCGGNDSLHQAREDFLRMNMLRDAIANNVCYQAEDLLSSSVFAQISTPVVVYLNGAYYGMLNMKQDFDQNLIEDVYGLPEEGVSLLKGKKDGKSMYYHIEAGEEQDLSDWQTLLAYCVENARSENYAEAYAKVAEQLDVANFSAYYAVMLYLCNTDWPQNNTMVWRYTPTEGDGTDGMMYADGRWRAVIRDMDLCFGLHDKASQTSTTTYSMADTDTFYRIMVFYRDGGYQYDASLGLYDDTMGFQGLFDFLMQSEDFRDLFVKDCEALCSEAFADLCRAEVDRYHAWALPEISAHIDWWKAEGEINELYTLQHFEASKTDMYTFIQDRPRYFRAYLDEALGYDD